MYKWPKLLSELINSVPTKNWGQKLSTGDTGDKRALSTGVNPNKCPQIGKLTTKLSTALHEPDFFLRHSFCVKALKNRGEVAIRAKACSTRQPCPQAGQPGHWIGRTAARGHIFPPWCQHTCGAICSAEGNPAPPPFGPGAALPTPGSLGQQQNAKKPARSRLVEGGQLAAFFRVTRNARPLLALRVNPHGAAYHCPPQHRRLRSNC